MWLTACISECCSKEALSNGLATGMIDMQTPCVFNRKARSIRASRENKGLLKALWTVHKAEFDPSGKHEFRAKA